MADGLRVEGLANVRDLGGRARGDGSLTPGGVFVRSERLDLVTPSGWAELRRCGVRTVVDLRRPEERSGSVPDDVRRVDVDLDGDERDFWEPVETDGRWATPLYYDAHLRELPHRLAAVLGALADAEAGAVLLHCGAGWDRTGLVAAVLLRAAGVTTDAATADYLGSFEHAAATAALQGRHDETEARQRVLSRYGHTAASAFAAAYDGLDLAAWFDHAGVDARVRAAVTTWRGTLGPPPAWTTD